MATQLDILRDGPRRVAEAYRQAAETALVNPYHTPAEQRARHDYYAAMAADMERNHG